FPFSQVERSHSIGLRYELTHLATNTPALDGNNPPSGLLAAATLSYAYSDARRFVRSISSEQGQRFAVAVRVAARALGSDLAVRFLRRVFPAALARRRVSPSPRLRRAALGRCRARRPLRAPPVLARRLRLGRSGAQHPEPGGRSSAHPARLRRRGVFGRGVRA